MNYSVLSFYFIYYEIKILIGKNLRSLIYLFFGLR